MYMYLIKKKTTPRLIKVLTVEPGFSQVPANITQIVAGKFVDLRDLLTTNKIMV